MTLLCVPILVAEIPAALADAREARDSGADLIEFRIDAFFHGEGFEKEEAATREIIDLVARSPLPCIVTCRPVLEGGHYDGPDDARIALFERLGALPASGKPGALSPHYIDCELATYTRSANLKQKINLAVDHPGQLRDLVTALILSTHDFHTRPPDLFRQLDRMHAEPACRVIKIAYRARSLRDNLELLDLLADARDGRAAHGNSGGSGGAAKPTIALAMGPFGLMSRVLAPKFEGFLTFASLRAASATAPGQPTVRELLELYRFRSIGTATKVYGVVGYPVEHSLSPHVHNAGFESVGHDGVYLPLPIPPEFEHFKATVLDLIEHPHLDLSGLSVTHPHKENLARLATEASAEGDPRWAIDHFARDCGAANTLTIRRDARGSVIGLSATNTDALALLAALSETRAQPTPAPAQESTHESTHESTGAPIFAGRPCLVLGAGGTARSVGLALAQAGAVVHVHNRSHEKAEALAALLAARAGLPPDPHLAPRAVTAADLAGPLGRTFAFVINCTPVGMEGGPAGSPLQEPIVRNFSPGCVVADCVYAPVQTPLLMQAAGAGLKTLSGLAMFVRQAAEQFSLWTRHAAPMKLFETVASETLAARSSPSR
ncbi:MAG: type I 3-dehydroquinate dehydratase [Phycisphaerales bacterium]